MALLALLTPLQPQIKAVYKEIFEASFQSLAPEQNSARKDSSGSDLRSGFSEKEPPLMKHRQRLDSRSSETPLKLEFSDSASERPLTLSSEPVMGMGMPPFMGFDPFSGFQENGLSLNPWVNFLKAFSQFQGMMMNPAIWIGTFPSGSGLPFVEQMRNQEIMKQRLNEMLIRKGDQK